MEVNGAYQLFVYAYSSNIYIFLCSAEERNSHHIDKLLITGNLSQLRLVRTQCKREKAKEEEKKLLR